jgi:hypothetical protein
MHGQERSRRRLAGAFAGLVLELGGSCQDIALDAFTDAEAAEGKMDERLRFVVSSARAFGTAERGVDMRHRSGSTGEDDCHEGRAGRVSGLLSPRRKLGAVQGNRFDARRQTCSISGSTGAPAARHGAH